MSKVTTENENRTSSVPRKRPKRPLWTYPPVDAADADRKIREFVAEHKEILEALARN